jgi:hypothetical protein
MTKDRASETIHFRVTTLAGPPAKEKLAQITRHAEFWLTRIATRAIHSISINRNRGFRAGFHIIYLGDDFPMVKVQGDASISYLCGSYLFSPNHPARSFVT